MTSRAALVIGAAAILLTALIGIYRWLTLRQSEREQKRRTEMRRAANGEK